MSAVAANHYDLLHPVRFVGYVDEALRAALPVALARPWVAEEACEPLASRLSRVSAAEAQRLKVRARALADAAMGLVRREALPPGDLIGSMRADPLGRLEIVGVSGAGKVRIDEDLAVALVRRKPFPASKAETRIIALRSELRATLSIAVDGADGKPVAARRVVDHDAIDPRGIAVELAPPAGGGFAAGRSDTLYVYSNLKVLLIALRPAQFLPDSYEPPHARGALGALHGRASGPLTSVGLVADDLAPEAWNDVPAELRYRKDAS